VNRLLDGADPILGAFRERRIAAGIAAARIGALERQFALFTVDVARAPRRAADRRSPI
jgi:hypothetical protein